MTTEYSQTGIPIANSNLPEGRLRYAVATIVVLMVLSVTYAWSVFRGPLAQLYGWTSSQTIAPYQYVLFFVPVGTIIGGFWQDRKGPRLVATVGGLLVGIGYLLAAWRSDTVRSLVFSYGILGGLGSGFAYVTPIATCIKWFPDRRGTMVGLAVLGTGFGPLVYGPVLESMIGHDPGQLHANLARTYVVLACVFFVGVVGAAQFLRVPPPGWKPAGWNPPPQRAGRSLEISSSGMLATWQFYLLWMIYFLGSSVGLTLIGEASPLIAATSRSTAVISGGTAVGLMAIFNSLGRLTWGTISDLLGRKATIITLGGVCTIACLICLRGASELAAALAGLCLATFGYGGYLALMPSVAADYYGQQNVGANYGLILSAWGVCGFTVPAYFARIIDRARDAGNIAAGYHQVFWKLAALAVVASLMAAVMRPPRDSATPHREP
jgi:MFS transporter, OFA family, oxalate/formate antiporter